MKFQKVKKIILGVLASCFTLALGGACSGGETANGYIPNDEKYIYNTDMPFYAEPDAFMTLDGKFEEEQWQDCKWLECSRVEDGTKLQMTTRFTQLGLYVGIIAYNDNITWDAKHNYPQNSNFYVQIAKEDEPHYGSYPIYNHPMRDAIFYIDAKGSLSLRETQYACGSYCDGELNGGNTKSLSAELFVSWEDMHYTQEELGMDGMPQNVRIFCKFMHPVSLYHGFIDQGAYSTYYLFNKTGIAVDYDSPYLGHAIGGESAFGDWIIEKENKKAYSTTTKTQTVWLKQDDFGNETSTATDYVAEVTVRGVQGQTGQYAGLMSMRSKTQFCFYTVNVPSLANGKISLRSGTAMDGSGWMSELRLNQTFVESGYQEDSVRLTVIKKGGDVYYLCNDEFVAHDYVDKITGKNVVGLYANGAAEFSDWSFKDYTNDAQGLNEVLSQYLYFINFKTSGRGLVTADRLAVPRTDGKAEITIMPYSGYVLTKLLFNGESKFEDYVENAQNGVYTYQTDEDLQVEATFTKWDSKDLYPVSISFKNEKTGETISSLKPKLTLYNQNTLLQTILEPNARGIVNADVLKAGVYMVDGRKIVSDGNYEILVSAPGYHDTRYALSLDLSKEYGEYVVEMSPVNWGSVTVNGATPATSGKLNLYDEEENIYGTNLNGTMKQFYLDSKTDGDYVVHANVRVAQKTQDGNVVGIMLTAGGTNTILLKSCSWEVNKLCLEVYDKNGNASEISITGFTHTLASVGGELQFQVIRLGDKIYVCNQAGEMVFFMDKEGVHTQGGFSFGSATKLKEVNAGLGDFFAKGKENAVGVVQYFTKGGEYWFNVQTDIRANSAIEYFNPVNFEIAQTAGVETSVSGTVEINGKYAENTQVTVIAESKTAGKVTKALRITYENDEQTVAGNYNQETGKTTFTFFIKGDCTASVVMGSNEHLLGDLTLNNLSVYQIGTPIYDETTDLYGADSSGTTWRYYADCKTDGDYAFTITTKVLEKNGFGHILGGAISAGGYSYMAFNACSWELNKLVLSVRDNTNTAKEIVISGFNNSIGAVGGNATITVVKLEQVFYVYNESGVLGFTIDQENGVTLQSGFTTTANAETISALNEKIKAFYALGNENALGFVSFKSGTGKYVFDATMAKGAEEMSERFAQVDTLVFTQSSDYQVQGLTASDSVKAFAKGGQIIVQVESLVENKKAKILQITHANGEISHVFGTYDAETRMTTFTFIMQSGGDVEITLDDVSNTISGNGFELGKDKDWAENPWLN